MMKTKKRTIETGTPLLLAIRRRIEMQEVPSQVEPKTERIRTKKYKSFLAGFVSNEDSCLPRPRRTGLGPFAHPAPSMGLPI
jgi:hypothetical protein